MQDDVYHGRQKDKVQEKKTETVTCDGTKKAGSMEIFRDKRDGIIGWQEEKGKSHEMTRLPRDK